MRSYKTIDIQKTTNDIEFQDFIFFFQNEYKIKVLLDNSTIDEKETAKSINNTNNLKEAVYDFFFEPRFENILDLVKFKNKLKPQSD